MVPMFRAASESRVVMLASAIPIMPTDPRFWTTCTDAGLFMKYICGDNFLVCSEVISGGVFR